MVSVVIPKSYLSKEILILDDEPEHLYWLVDYIEAKGFTSKVVTNAAEAINEIKTNKYLGYILDLNIPLGNWQPNVIAPNSSYEKYKGFYIAKYIRSQGVKGRNVIMYSAHSNEEIKNEVQNLYIEYIAKGRAAEFKFSLDQILSKANDVEN